MHRAFWTSTIVAAGLLAACSDRRTRLRLRRRFAQPDGPTGCPTHSNWQASRSAFHPTRPAPFRPAVTEQHRWEDVGGRRPRRAESRAAFIDFTLNRYYQGKLATRPRSPASHQSAVVQLIDGVLCWVGLPPSGYACRERHTSNHAGHRSGRGQFKAKRRTVGSERCLPRTVSEDRLWVITRLDVSSANGNVRDQHAAVPNSPCAIDFSVVLRYR